MYEASILPNYNFTPETPADLPGHSFGGWFTTPEGTPGTEFVWTNATMPDHNLRLFAKWVPPVYTVSFDYTKPDSTVVQHDVQQVIQGQKAVRPDDPVEIPGYNFDGWYYSGTSTKYVFDAQVFANQYLTGRYLPKNDRSYTVLYLFADDTQAAPPKTVSGQTTGTTVTEQAVEVPGFLPDALSKTHTLEADNNVITFYYSIPNVNYTVRYLERGTGKVLRESVTKNSQGHTVVTEDALVINNEPYQLPDSSWVVVDFKPDMPQKSLTLTSNPDLNVITFYYEFITKNTYEVRYLEYGTDAVLAELKHVITAKSEVVELPKVIAKYKPHSVEMTEDYEHLVRSSSANYISTGLAVSDPLSQVPQVITFYYMPEHIEITGNKTWVDQGATDQRPSFSDLPLTIFANQTEISPQPTPIWTNNSDTWAYKYINLPAAEGGAAILYTVRETVPDKYAASYTDKGTPGGTDITNTLDGGTTTFSGTKTWVDTPDPESGFSPRPDHLELTFYRKGYNDTDYVETDPQPAYTWDKDTGPDTWTYTATGLKKYEAGYPVLYKAKEAVPGGYTQTLDNGQYFENEVIYTTATKTWVDGPESRPTIWLRLYRQVGATGTPELVPNAVWKALTSGTTEVSWRGLEQTDDQGEPYIFTVREVNVNGDPFTPENYIKEEEGLNVTNTYVIPANGKATATKTWVNGSATHPDLWLQLWRKTSTGTPLIDEPVPLDNNANVIKTEVTGDTSYEWTGLEETDSKGNAYTFYIKEGQWDGSTFTESVPANYKITSGEGTLNLVNTYDIPNNGSFIATKEWKYGTEIEKPDVWFQLQRRVVGTETWTAVPDVTPLQVPKEAPYAVTWTDLEETDSAARTYEFSVVEGRYAAGTFTPGSPSPFDTTTGEYTDEITNTYVSPKREDIVVEKVFATTCTGAVAPVTEVTLELWRESDDEAEHQVGDSVILDGNIDSVEFYPWQAKFTNLDDTDKNGYQYTYKVKELNIPANYEATFDQENFTVTNTWQTVSYTVNKKWEGGYTGMEHPSIQLQLWRKTSEMAEPEQVPLVGLVTLNATTNNLVPYTWTNLPKNDNNNNPYEYTVSEVTSLIGYTTTGPAKVDNVDTFINEYEETEMNVSKVFRGEMEPHELPDLPEYVELQLIRKVGGNETVVETVQLDGVADSPDPAGSGETDPDTDPDGYPRWNYSWKYLPKNDADGTPFIYEVREPVPPTGWERLTENEDDETHWTITNMYRGDIFRAFKYWNTRTGTVPVTFRLEYLKLDTLNNPVGDWTDMGIEKDVVLNGIADDEETGSGNGSNYYEDYPWSAVWTDLDTQIEGYTVKYRVNEMPITPSGSYEVDAGSSASTVITNVSQKRDITAAKVWVNGEEVRPQNVTLILKRYFEDGTTPDDDYGSQTFILQKPTGGGDN